MRRNTHGITVLQVLLVVVAMLWGGVAMADRAVKIQIRDSEDRDAGVVETVPLYSQSHALVIGIDDYSQGWPRLSGAVKDARQVKTALEANGFDVDLKTNLTSSELEDALKEFFILKGSDEDARLFLWYAGHGHTINGEGYLVPRDAPSPSDETRFKFKALSMRRFGEYVRQAKSKHALTVFDACFSGTIFQTQRSAPPMAVTLATTLPVRQFLSSGDADQTVSDNGQFRKLFIRAITGEEHADANDDGYLTGSELGLYMTDRLTNLTQARQTPKYGKLRDEDYDRGDFVFLLASSGATVDTPVTDAGRYAVPQSSTIKVTANVKGAEVTIDGVKKGVTDLSPVTVSEGEHRVAVSKDGYETYRQTVTVRKGRQLSMQVILDPVAAPKGALYVNTQPEDATVKILNIGPAFYQGIPLDAGRYHVTVSRSGYETDDRWVDLSAGEDKTLTIRLGKKESAPEAAESGFTNSLGMKFVYIEPGSFMMGSPSSEPNRDKDETQHRVTLTQGYFMQTTEVTQGQWRAVMGNNPSYFKNCGDDCPVENVSWNDVQEFIGKLNRKEGKTYRLPTEAEWEYACRAGSDTPYANGNSLDTMGWYTENSGGKIHRVAQKKTNAWGLYDMHGNVWEWCQDWKGDYPSGSVTDPQGASSGSGRVFRGGGWGSGARGCRSALRGRLGPGLRDYGLGFRLVCLQAGR